MHRSLHKSILLTGDYGFYNLGDDAFPAVTALGAKKYWNTKKISVLSNIPILDDVPIDSYTHSKKRLFKGHLFLKYNFQMIRSSAILIAGGSLFSSVIPNRGSKNSIYKLSKFNITPAGAIGVSIGPFQSSAAEKSVYRFLKALKFLALRDKASFEYASSLVLPYKPILAADLVMALPTLINHDTQKKTNNRILGVMVCHYERYVNSSLENERRREELVLESLKRFVKKNIQCTIRFYVFNGSLINGDNEITDYFAQELKSLGAQIEIIPYETTPIATWKSISECNAVISIRLHGAIFAVAAQVPCILVEYHRKCSDFLDDIGVDSRYRIGDANCSPDEISQGILDLLEKNSTNGMYKNREQIISRALLNFSQTANTA